MGTHIPLLHKTGFTSWANERQTERGWKQKWVQEKKREKHAQGEWPERCERNSNEWSSKIGENSKLKCRLYCRKKHIAFIYIVDSFPLRLKVATLSPHRTFRMHIRFGIRSFLFRSNERWANIMWSNASFFKQDNVNGQKQKWWIQHKCPFFPSHLIRFLGISAYWWLLCCIKTILELMSV